ncbi:hypothetical protein JCM8202v2_003098, partial [Rhodotorula sphaerocarpa]
MIRKLGFDTGDSRTIKVRNEPDIDDGGRMDDIFRHLPQMRVEKPPKAFLGEHSLRGQLQAEVAAGAANKTLPPSLSTEVTSASEGGHDDDESDSDPTTDGDEPKMKSNLLSTPTKAPAIE